MTSAAGDGDATISGPWPQRLIIVSHEFKRKRFLELHLRALQFPVSSVEFVGIDPPFEEARMEEIRDGDAKRGYGVWKGDLYGAGELLQKKRRERFWDEDAFVHEIGLRDGSWDEAVSHRLLELLHWTGGSDGKTLIPSERVPWSITLSLNS